MSKINLKRNNKRLLILIGLLLTTLLILFNPYNYYCKLSNYLHGWEESVYKGPGIEDSGCLRMFSETEPITWFQPGSDYSVVYYETHIALIDNINQIKTLSVTNLPKPFKQELFTLTPFGEDWIVTHLNWVFVVNKKGDILFKQDTYKPDNFFGYIIDSQKQPDGRVLLVAVDDSGTGIGIHRVSSNNGSFKLEHIRDYTAEQSWSFLGKVRLIENGCDPVIGRMKKGYVCIGIVHYDGKECTTDWIAEDIIVKYDKYNQECNAGSSYFDPTQNLEFTFTLAEGNIRMDELYCLSQWICASGDRIVVPSYELGKYEDVKDDKINLRMFEKSKTDENRYNVIKEFKVPLHNVNTKTMKKVANFYAQLKETSDSKKEIMH